MSKIVVFLGPSLRHAEALRYLQADIRPPCAVGDVYRAVRGGATTLVIIDGYFEQVPAVFHKEILYALQSGVAVYGAASMGALRAAELDRFGMIGLGSIYARFRSGEYEADDEVAVAHGLASDDFRPLSDALVNIRHGLEQARARDLLDAEQHDRLLQLARTAFYAERSWKALWKQAQAANLPPSVIDKLRTFIADTKPDLKRDDAILALATVHESAGHAPRGHASFVLSETTFWRKLVAEAESCPHREMLGTLPREIRAQLFGAERAAFNLASLGLLRVLAAQEAERLGLQLDAELVQRFANDFRRRAGLRAKADLDRWLADRQMTVRDFVDLMRTESAIYRLSEHHDGRLPRSMHDVQSLTAAPTESSQPRAEPARHRAQENGAC